MKLIDLLSSNKLSNKKILVKVISYFTNKDKEYIFGHVDDQIDEDTVKKIEKACMEYIEDKKPLEYILWEVELWKLKLKVNNNVLIPRPETEYLIEEAGIFLINKKDHLIVDIWTWSWVIWIWLINDIWHTNNNWILTDISQWALDVAEKNCKNYFWDNTNIRFLISNLASFLLDNTLKKLPNIQKDNICILANLPYIPNKTFREETSDHVKNWEPDVAFLGWDDWLDLYRKLLNQLDDTILQESKITTFFEMIWWQVDILKQEYPNWHFKIVSTFHFNIKILKCYKYM